MFSSRQENKSRFVKQANGSPLCPKKNLKTWFFAPLQFYATGTTPMVTECRNLCSSVRIWTRNRFAGI